MIAIKIGDVNLQQLGLDSISQGTYNDINSDSLERTRLIFLYFFQSLWRYTTATVSQMIKAYQKPTRQSPLLPSKPMLVFNFSWGLLVFPVASR